VAVPDPTPSPPQVAKPVRRGPPPLKPISLPPLVPTFEDESPVKHETMQSIVKVEPSMPLDIEDEIV